MEFGNRFVFVSFLNVLGLGFVSYPISKCRIKPRKKKGKPLSTTSLNGSTQGLNYENGDSNLDTSKFLILIVLRASGLKATSSEA